MTTTTNDGGAALPPPNLVRRTSSIAYDGRSSDPSGGCYSAVDLWRERRMLPPRSSSSSTTTTTTRGRRDRNRATTTALASAASPSVDDQGEGGGDERRRPMPMYTFGVLTDIQYAPIPDGHSYGGNARYYRHAREAAGYAARHFQEERAQCVLNLGDIIDGKCADVERWGGTTVGGGGGGGGVGHEAIDDVLEALGSYRAGPILHTYGNHELYNLSRLDLAKKLSIPFTLEPTNDLVGYYDHVLHEPRHWRPRRRDGTDDDDDDSDHPWKLRFVVVDSFDICLLDRCPETSPKRRAAHEIMMANNPNYPEQENSPEGLVGLSRRFVAFNGGIDEPQLEWLARSMEDARANGERVIVCSHQPIHPDSSFPTCLVWNYEDVLSIVRKYADVVIASFSGHAHKGGYVRDEVSGVHFRTFEAMLESPSPVRTYAIVDMYSDSFVVRGSGDCVSDVYDLDHLNVNREKIAVANDL
jgi:manganese-dependent ADP-ribose/CDP-alcohol diphosphatase